MNPMIQMERREDARYGTLFHKRLDEIRRVGAGVKRYSPNERTMMAAQLTTLIKEDSNPVLRANATRALGNFPAPLASIGIGLAMADDDFEVRIAATEACRVQNDDTSRQRLVALLQDDRLDVQLAAIKQLAEFEQHPTTIAALGEFLDHENPVLQARAVETLSQTSGRDYGDNLKIWKQFVLGRNPPIAPKGSFDP
jgi:hypothetical protein